MSDHRPDLPAIAAADLARLDRRRSSGPAVKAHGCIAKKRYGQRAAKFAARILRKQTGEELHHYPCQFCHHWHVGHGIDLPPYSPHHATHPQV